MTPTTDYVPETFPRHFVPADVSLTTWELIEPWYQKLLYREIQTPTDLEEWLRDAGELNGVVGQEGAERYVAMTCQTDDPKREAAYLEFVRDIEPRLKPYLNEVRAKYLDSPHRAGLPADVYAVFDRAQAVRRELYREANVPRETELAELEQQYQKVVGAMSVTFRGEEYTPARMAPFYEDTDRATRQEAWELVAARRLVDRDAMDDLFDRMIALRQEIASEAGFDSYIGYAYKSRERFDYGVAEATAFQDAIARVVVPLAGEMHEARRVALGVEALRPWDTSVDPLGRPPLRPTADPDKLAEGTEAIFAAVDPELAAQFRYMRTHNLLDLPNRKGKAPGGYQTTFEDMRLPFIFMNAVGVDGDLRTLLHEGGHAFHALASRGQTLAAYRESPIEFCEVASMSMELLGAKDTAVFYDEAEAGRSYRQLLEGIVAVLPWIATVDAFQHWVYAHPGHTRDERRAAWDALLDRFGGDVDWSGYEEARSSGWHRQLHIFLYPFYYIEYGIAQLGALQVWLNARQDRAKAVADYRRGLSLGGSRPLPELFAAAGARFDFSEGTLAPLVGAIRQELAGLAP